MGDRTKVKKPKMDNPEQSKRFVETARELGVDESGESFERIVRNLPRKRDRRGPDTERR